MAEGEISRRHRGQAPLLAIMDYSCVMDIHNHQRLLARDLTCFKAYGKSRLL